MQRSSHASISDMQSIKKTNHIAALELFFLQIRECIALFRSNSSGDQHSTIVSFFIPDG